ncbi:MAG: hypothetical protein ABL929_01405 [Ferruginibacter sp.]|nr:hypothetical protein [Ferruginibacter sp.]
MKRILFLVVIATMLFGFTNAQRITSCGYKVPPRSLVKNSFASVYEAKAVVTRMLDSIQWKENFNLKEQNGIQNAYATISGGQRWIVYDNKFLEDIDAYSKTKWASISIMAHEMGHHYYNHVASMQGSTVPSEIEADAFSGYMVQRQGGTLEQALAAMQAIGTDRQTSTHPAKADRLAAITRGWNAAKASSPATTANTGSGSTVPNPTNGGSQTSGNGGGNTNPQTSSENDPSWIALYIQSTQDETVQLSDDGRTFQNAPIKAGEPFIFKFEIYEYGWLKLPYYNGFRTYKLLHGKDYSILYNRRNKNWTVVEIPN